MLEFSMVDFPNDDGFPSNGNVAYIRLAEKLMDRGHWIHWLKFVDQWETEAPKGSINILSQAFPFNPYSAEKVVKWVITPPKYTGGERTFFDDELIVRWSDDIPPADAPILRLETLDRNTFFDDGRERNCDVWYKGKASKLLDPIPEFDKHPEDAIEITRHPRSPASKRELGDLFRRANTFYTYDDYTQLIDEALLCGCRVVTLPSGEEVDKLHTPDDLDEEEMVDNFIRLCEEKWGDEHAEVR